MATNKRTNFRGGGETVSEGKSSKTKLASLVLDVLNNVAIRNANSACRGFIYEPKVPKKLTEEK